MAYNPISLNVILQAMRHMTFPKPRRASASSHMISAPSGTIMRQMTLTFATGTLLSYFERLTGCPDTPTSLDIRVAIEQCFCEDVQVFQVTWSHDLTSIDIDLLCSVSAHD